MRENGPAFAVSVLLASAVKLAFSRLGPDDLRVLTAPTQALVGLATGIDFTYEAGYGYVNLPHRLVIAKSCTGVNYLLAVFGLLVASLVPEIAGRRRKVLAVGALAAGAYGVTVAVNALRITLGIVLHEGGLAWGWLDAARVHRLGGIVVYFVSLLAVHAAGRRVLRLVRGGARAASPILLAPLACYVVVTVAVPLANGASIARPILFAEHCAWIALVALLSWTVLLCLRAIDRHRRATLPGDVARA